MGAIMYNGNEIPIIESAVCCKNKIYGLSRDDDAEGYSLYEIDKKDIKIKMHFSMESGATMKLAVSETDELKIFCSNGVDAEEPMVDLAEIIKKTLQ